ncbi:sugar phosphate isomerase/epimerase family protein [Geomesophilobacter sediminis]|uniref:Sugar phosphate isomerase/epimerase n=1 Tax=Geomesophilobacter sediminis TaxID=2798584 RepID=A0A8J7IYB1_9BACT|nr:sugar phosphate isomerase/epimerase family protein [Geomesophilobacter sediminis]MBJ6725117.1 sugar phosphate isomerase/epimerase [Geomesophilobacter sediminis]
MIISISTGTLFIFPLEKVFEIALEVGFDTVELVINQEFQKVNARKLVRHLAQQLPIRSIHAPFMPLDGWGGPVDSLKRCVEIAGECGVELVNFHPPSWLGMELGYWRWLYKIYDFQKEVGQGKVILTLENMPWTGKYNLNHYILSETGKMIDFLHERNLYLTFDCTHMGSGKANFINDFYLFYNSGRIRNIHFSDYGHGRQHLLPGHGILPLTRFLNHLRNTAYNESVTLELSPHEFPRDERIIVQSLKEILQYLRKETQKEEGEQLQSTVNSEP